MYHHEAAAAGKSGLQSICTGLSPSIITAVNEYHWSTWLFPLHKNTSNQVLCSCHQAGHIIQLLRHPRSISFTYNPSSGPHLLGCYWIGAPGLSLPAPAPFSSGLWVCTLGRNLHSVGRLSRRVKSTNLIIRPMSVQGQMQSEGVQMLLRKKQPCAGVRRGRNILNVFLWQKYELKKNKWECLKAHRTGQHFLTYWKMFQNN